MYEPKTALELEQLAARLIETIERRKAEGKGGIKYLSGELLSLFNDGYDKAIIDMGRIRS